MSKHCRIAGASGRRNELPIRVFRVPAVTQEACAEGVPCLCETQGRREAVELIDTSRGYWPGTA